MEKFSLEKVQEEAAKLQQKVESGKAWDYAHAERLIRHGSLFYFGNLSFESGMLRL
jgi:hypothetical protein